MVRGRTIQPSVQMFGSLHTRVHAGSCTHEGSPASDAFYRKWVEESLCSLEKQIFRRKLAYAQMVTQLLFHALRVGGT